MPTHLNLRYQEIEELWPGIQLYQKLAEHYGVPDIFSDNGGKVAQLAIAVGLDIVPGRRGPDACDRSGNEYELKTLDIGRGVKGFSTNHHLHSGTIERYRSRRFIFATYKDITLQEAYLVMPDAMEPVFDRWEVMLCNRDHLNNPKIPLDFIRDIGEIMYLKDVAPAWMEGKTPLVDALSET